MFERAALAFFRSIRRTTLLFMNLTDVGLLQFTPSQNYFCREVLLSSTTSSPSQLLSIDRLKRIVRNAAEAYTFAAKQRLGGG